MLHITNGDAAAGPIRALGLGGEVLSWRDVLYDGPVPAPATLDSLRPLRARFLSSGDPADAVRVARELEERDRRLGAALDEGVVLWFEHDLYDQLQLAQILDHVASRPAAPARVMLAQSDEYLGSMDPAALRALWDRRAPVTGEQLAAAARAWRAFSHHDPRAIEDAAGDLAALPFLGPALRRHLEEFPAVENGLSRTERQILETLVVGSWTLRELFPAAHHDRESPIFLGDLGFFDLLRGLAAGHVPLLVLEDDRAWLTDAGRDVLAGRRDRVATLGIDRWLGGVHLKGHRVPFRWDGRARQIVAA
jgi:hypothetical protein